MQRDPTLDAPETATGPTELAERLGDAIAELPEYERYVRAETQVAEDEAAQAKIDAFEERREAFALARKTGDATEEDLRELRRFQEELHSMPVMAEYLDAKAALTDRLEELNRTISAPLAVDFGEEAGGCCHD